MHQFDQCLGFLVLSEVPRKWLTGDLTKSRPLEVPPLRIEVFRLQASLRAGIGWALAPRQLLLLLCILSLSPTSYLASVQEIVDAFYYAFDSRTVRARVGPYPGLIRPQTSLCINSRYTCIGSARNRSSIQAPLKAQALLVKVVAGLARRACLARRNVYESNHRSRALCIEFFGFTIRALLLAPTLSLGFQICPA